MSHRLNFFLLTGTVLVLLWGTASWYFGQVSQRAFNQYILLLSEHSHERIFEIKLDDYQETYLGAEAKLTVQFSVPSLDSLFGELKLHAKRLNGPVFIDDGNIEFGIARWTFLIDQKADDVLSNVVETLFNHKIPTLVVRFDYFEGAHFEFLAKQVRSNYFSVDEFIAMGQLGLNDGSYKLLASFRKGSLSAANVSLDLSKPELTIQRFAQNSGLDAHANAAVFNLNAKNSVLSFKQDEKGFPLDVNSRGSLWFINDTLNGDWQMLVGGVSVIDTYKLHINLQFRKWLTEGVVAYWRQQLKVANLYEQVEWVLEDGAETPEEQDLIQSLYNDADRIERLQLQHILEEMLLRYQHSELTLNAQLKKKDDVLGQLIVTGKTDGSELVPRLNLDGEAIIRQEVLSSTAISRLETWNQRLWLRRYETAFETDLGLRNQQFLLNNIRVPWEDLGSELKQLLNDQ